MGVYLDGPPSQPLRLGEVVLVSQELIVPCVATRTSIASKMLILCHGPSS